MIDLLPNTVDSFVDRSFQQHDFMHLSTFNNWPQTYQGLDDSEMSIHFM